MLVIRARADDGLGLEGDNIIIDDARVEIGQINPDMPLAARNIHPAFTFHGNDNRAQPLLRRNIQRADRRSPGNTVRLYTVVHLELLHGGLQNTVIAADSRALQIAHGYKPVAQGNDGWPRTAGRKPNLRHGRTPTTLGDCRFQLVLGAEQPGIFRGGGRKIANEPRSGRLGENRPSIAQHPGAAIPAQCRGPRGSGPARRCAGLWRIAERCATCALPARHGPARCARQSNASINPGTS